MCLMIVPKMRLIALIVLDKLENKYTEEITLLIEDNGTGFDKKLLMHSKGNGWKNLNLRSDMIGGVLEL